MKTPEPITKSQNVGNPKEEMQKGIENHKLAASHFEEAAKYHLEAAKYQESGQREKADESSAKAREHSNLAHRAENGNVKKVASQF